jgi:hypothetical protein
VVLSQLVREWLGGRPAQAQTSGSSQQLTSLATGKTCSYKDSNDALAVSWDVQVWGMRSFASATDYYLANFNPTLTPAVTDVTQYVVNSLTLMEVAGSTSDNIDTSQGFIIDTDPATVTSSVSSYTNGSSTTVSGSVGFDGEALTGSIGASTTVENETTTSVPPVTILNESDTTTLEPSWTFEPESTTAGADFAPMTAWVWQLPQAAYPQGGTGTNQISFSPGANLFAPGTNTTFVSTCNVTVPFTTWTINAPVLTSLSPTAQAIGNIVTVEGQYLYDGITTVLLGGTAVDSTNLFFSSGNPTSFLLAVPGDASIGDNEILVSTTVSTTSGAETLLSATGLTLNVTSD